MVSDAAPVARRRVRRITASSVIIFVVLALFESGLFFFHGIPESSAANTQIFLTSTASTTWTVPVDWNNASNTIECVGAGGNGAQNATLRHPGAGGGGGAYAKVTNQALSAGSVVIKIAAGGSATGTYITNNAGTIILDCGAGGNAANTTVGAGGTVITGVGNAGGSGGSVTDTVGGRPGGGVGAAAGPSGVGEGGLAAGTGSNNGGGGGGGSNGGTGGTAGGTNGGNGGNGHGGTGGGTGGTNAVGGNGTAGTGGGGGGGDGGSASVDGFQGGSGAIDQAFDASHGSGGGGGGGGGANNTAHLGGNGGPGGTYGGGGGGGGASGASQVANGQGGAGGQGVIVITYTPPNLTVSAVGSHIATTTIPSSGFYVGGAFAFVRDAATGTVSQIVVTASGTVNAAANLSNLILFYKVQATCSTSSLPTGLTQFNSTGVSFNGSSTATATGTMSVGTSQVCVYAQVDVGSGASSSQVFQFEIANPSTNVTVDAGTVSPASVVAIGGRTTLNDATITVGTTGTQIATTSIPKDTFYVGGAFTFSRNAGTSTVTQIVLSEKGTVNANANLSNVKLFYETAATCATSSIPGTVTPFNAATTFNASDQATATGTMSVGAAQVCVYVQFDVGTGANASDTVEIEISNPSTDVTVAAGVVAPSSAVPIAGTTTLQALSQFLVEHDYRIYDNVDAVNPVSPLAAENASATDILQNEVIRIRLNIISSGGSLPTSSQALKLRYALKDGFATCGNVPSGNYADVGAATSSEVWRGFNNTSTADGAVISTTLLTTSTVGESYAEANPTPVNPKVIPVNGVGEWDFVVQNNGAQSGSGYCFRVVKSAGTALAQYDNLPEVKVIRPLFEVHYRWRNDDGGE